MSILSNVTIPSQGNFRYLCWASVTIGVCTSFNDPPRTLREVATKCLSRCDGDMTSTFCDLPCPLEDSLSEYGHAAKLAGRQLQFGELQQQIDTLSRPVPILLHYNSVDHCCLLKGCLVVEGVEQVVLLNPSDASPVNTYIRFDALAKSSPLGAPWSDTYTVS